MKNSFFNGSVRLRVTGLNLDKFLNSVVNSGIKVHELVRDEHKAIEFSVVHKYQKTVALLAENKPYSVAVIASSGVPAALVWARKRLALLVCLLVASCLVAAFNGFIWQVKIVGTQDIAENEVKNALVEAGFKQVSLKKNIDRKKLETGVLVALPRVSYVNVYYRGITMFVEIVEALPKTEAISKEPRDIVAVADGIVTRIVTISGTAVVKVGDTVSAGQVLISRSVTYPDGSTKEVRAEGEVYAEVSHTGECGFFGSEADFESRLESLQKKAAEKAMLGVPQGSCVIATKYDIITDTIGKTVKATLLVERLINETD